MLLGDCTYGTLGHPPLGPYINGPMPQGSKLPWGKRNVNNTNPYDDSSIPNTGMYCIPFADQHNIYQNAGMTRYYSWTVTNTTLSPDGVEIPMIVVNGQFPGPLIEANWGDWIQVEVINGMSTLSLSH